jgi:signal transduction histidine kinase
MSPARTHRFSTRPDAVTGWLGAAVLVGVVYVVVVRGGGVLIGRTTSPHLGLSVLATAIVALSIEPARVRIERFARRHLNLGRPSPYGVLAEFSHQLAGSANAEQMTSRIARMLAEGTGVAWAQVWLLVNDRLTLVAAHPPEARTPLDPPTLDGNEGCDGLRSVAVGHGGGRLGVLRVQEHADRPLSSVEQRLFVGLAAQAGLVLHNAQLRAELTSRHNELVVRAAELRRSRDQLVVAQDQERRKLERDIHDGAQQQLVALGINLRLAQTLAVKTPDRAAELLAEQAEAATDASETLSTLSRGVYPRLLSEHGLPDALAAVAATSPIPARLHVADVGRFTRAVEGTMYFCCLEALQNAAKHSVASSIDVHLVLALDRLNLTVTDNGSGIAPGAEAGVGITNMRDRVESLGGNVTVESRPGVGTSVAAVVPALRVPAQQGD